MKILAIDTSSPIVSVAASEDGRIRSAISKQGNASTLLAPMIQLVLKDAGWKLEHVDAFAVGEGPGSYNGLRCGFATLAGILLSHPRPVTQVNSLAAAAAGAKAGYAGVILNARKNMLFYQKFKMENGAPKLEEEKMVANEDEIHDLDSADTCWLSYDVPGFQLAFPSAAAVAQLSLGILKTPGYIGRLGEPRYLRPPV